MDDDRPILKPQQALNLGPYRGLTRCTQCISDRFGDHMIFVAVGPDYGWFCSWACVSMFTARKRQGEGNASLAAIQSEAATGA